MNNWKTLILPLWLWTLLSYNLSQASTDTINKTPPQVKPLFQKLSHPSTKNILNSIKSGDTLYSLLKKHKYSEVQVRKILNSPQLPKSFTLIPKERYLVRQHKDQMELKFYPNDNDKVLYFWRKGLKNADVTEEFENFEIKTVTQTGKVVGSLLESLKRNGADKLMAYKFMDAFRPYLNLKRDIQKNAPFKLTFEKIYDSGFYIKSDKLLMAQLNVKEKVKTLYFIPFPTGGSFISPNETQKNRPFYSPVEKIKISSPYNPRRFHPIKRRRVPHWGIDYELPQGELVFGIQKGVIKKLGRNRAAGRYIVIQHANGYTSYYNHLGFIEPNIKVGDKIKPGEVIARIGCSGYCTKSHLHFALKKNGRYINPIKLIKTYPVIYEKKISRERQKLVANSKKLPIKHFRVFVLSKKSAEFNQR